MKGTHKRKVTVPSNVDETDTKLMLVDKTVVDTIDDQHKFVRKYLYEIIERISNDIKGDTTLGVTLNDMDDNALFFQFSFEVLNHWEIYLFDVDAISSDRYLDLMLEGRIVKTHTRRIRQIFQ